MLSATVQLFLVFLTFQTTCALNNGLARTPPMGWLSWERFECNTDCQSDPDNCIGERLVKLQADVMASEGYRDAGYEYITLDDCWPARERDSHGKLQPDPKRFPSGMRALADYVHSKGLKMGLYEDVGRHTCAGAPGTQDHYQLDAQTLAEWHIDMLKFDGCNTDEQHYRYGYPAMGKFLNETGRKILYSCEWPIYERAIGVKPNYTAVAETCNTFRVYGDIWDNYQSIQSIVNFYGSDNMNFSEVAGPGSWCDADQLTIGNFGLSSDGERTQMGMWAIIASPLLMSVNLRTINPESKNLLLNQRVLAISQDPLGIPGKRILTMLDDNIQVWTRPVTPPGSYAIAVINMLRQGYPQKVSVKLQDIEMIAPRGYNISEVFDGGHIGYFKPSQNITCRVNPSGIVLLKASVL